MTFDLLVAARKVIEDPKRHNTGCFTEPSWYRQPAKFCAVGAILHANHRDPLDREAISVLHITGHPVNNAVKALARAANLMGPEGLDLGAVFCWNDITPHPAILHAFDIAILNEYAILQEFDTTPAAQPQPIA